MKVHTGILIENKYVVTYLRKHNVNLRPLNIQSYLKNLTTHFAENGPETARSYRKKMLQAELSTLNI